MSVGKFVVCFFFYAQAKVFMPPLTYIRTCKNGGCAVFCGKPHIIGIYLSVFRTAATTTTSITYVATTTTTRATAKEPSEPSLFQVKIYAHLAFECVRT